MSSLTVPRKILIGFFVLIAITVFMGATGYLALKGIYLEGDEISENRLPAVDTLRNISRHIWATSARERSFEVPAYSGDLRKSNYKNIEESLKLIDESIKKFEKFELSKDEKELWGDFLKNYQEWRSLDTKLVEANLEIDRANGNQDSKGLTKLKEKSGATLLEIRKPLNTAVSFLDKLTNYNVDFTRQLSTKMDDNFSRTSTLLLFSVVCAVVLGVGLTFYLSRELSKLAQNLNRSTLIVNDGTKELAAGNQDLASRTQEQASSIEETAATLEEITSTVKQTAENSQRAAALASQSVQRATEGNQKSQETQQAMSAISSSSKKISEIVGLVEDIAFQTNILAINAAIEAAKAGDQGKGFAVVAIEVRDLAQRSAEATKEIKELIETSVEKVANGERLVLENSEKLKEITSNISQVAEIMSDISTASKEQYSAVEQINVAITQIDSMTQQNSSLVEEIASSSTNMATETANMSYLISRYLFRSQEGSDGLEHKNPEREHFSNKGTKFPQHNSSEGSKLVKFTKPKTKAKTHSQSFGQEEGRSELVDSVLAKSSKVASGEDF